MTDQDLISVLEDAKEQLLFWGGDASDIAALLQDIKQQNMNGNFQKMEVTRINNADTSNNTTSL